MSFFQWLLDERAVSQGTAREYVAEVRRAMGYGDPINRLRDATLAPKSRRLTLAALRSWAIYTKDAKLGETLAPRSPIVRRLPAAENASVRRPLSDEEWGMVLRALRKEKSPEAAILGVMATRGLRVGDVLRMTRKQVQDGVDHGRCRFTAKGQRILEYDLEPSKDFLRILAAQKGRWSRVWELCGPSSRAARQVVMEVFRELGQKLGLPADESYTHRLRRTVATAFVKKLKGDPLAMVKLQRWMGWSSLETAKKYVDYILQEELDTVGRNLSPV